MRIPDLIPARTVSAPSATGPGEYRPWFEVSVRLDLTVADWQWHDSTWVHWVLPVGADGGAVLSAARPFDPGRRAASPGAPPGTRAVAPELNDQVATKILTELLSRYGRRLHRQPELGLVSGLDEDLDAFRRRCLSVLGPALRSATLAREDGPDLLAALHRAIESRQLGEDELVAAVVRVGIGWYPPGVEPSAPVRELLLGGGVRSSAG